MGHGSAAGWPVDTRIRHRLSGWFRGELQGDARAAAARTRYQVRIEIDIGPWRACAHDQPGRRDIWAGTATRGLRGNCGAAAAGTPGSGPERITFEDGRELPRPAGVQDTASQFVALSHRFASGQQPLAAGLKFGALWLARPGAVDEWTTTWSNACRCKRRRWA